MTRKRSKYRPKGVNPNAHLLAIMGAACMSADDAKSRSNAVRIEVEAACAGSATLADWRGIFDAVNMAEQFIRDSVADGIEAIHELQDTIEAIADRQRDTGTKALHPHERAALRDFAADYAGILSGVTHQQYMQAQRRVEDRIRRILSGEKIPASVRVIEGVA